MRRFSQLFEELDRTNKVSEKVEALVRYFKDVEAAEAAWAIYFLSGRRPKHLVKALQLCNWVVDAAGIPEWLLDECYEATGDLAEALSLVLPASSSVTSAPLDYWVEEKLLSIRGASEPEQKRVVTDAWASLEERERFVFNKLLTGALRVGVSQQLLIKALSEVGELETSVIAHRLAGDWQPSAQFYQSLMSVDYSDTATGRPYPFFLAHSILECELDDLGDPSQWIAEWKWDGIRAQIIRRGSRTFIWSRGEELISDKFPELLVDAEYLPDGTVLDGEILPWKGDAVMSFSSLQRRIGRSLVTKEVQDEIPVVFMAYDILEHDSQDVRSMPLAKRRQLLVTLVEKLARVERQDELIQLSLFSVPDPVQVMRIKLSLEVPIDCWEDLKEKQQGSRALGVEGFMLKRLSSPYGVGRPKGDWWKWKVAPFSVDAVLTQAQSGHGVRAGLFTDYTFAIWDDNGELVPFARAYSGLTREEIEEINSYVKGNTLARYGPVRVVKPALVFELAFESIQESTRHKSGIAVRFPRIIRWRKDKQVTDADTLEGVKALLKSKE